MDTFVARFGGLSYEEFSDSLEFIYPDDGGCVVPNRVPPELRFDVAHWTDLKSLAASQSRVEQKSTECSKSPETAQALMFSRWLRGTSEQGSSGSQKGQTSGTSTKP